ncbi:CHAP domain-containing protein [Acidiphilium sp.]|uniref:CHAP domain-containing protein n=2 Tax=unclassified Acidiphilium TaxID=2617493 RepID=UPI002D1FADC7|nr:CHAP domain-containing protein [Acidiphilium sp.]
MIRHVVERRPVETHHTVIRHVAARRMVDHPPVVHHVVLHEARSFRVHYPHRLASSHGGYRWCVPYARVASHIDIKGDAFLWWAEAAGRYARGHRPEARAVLNFRPTGRMPLGHVAVVAKVINSREVLVNQANWIPDTVSHDVPVIDVSPHNNWTEVRVALGNGRFGMTYPTYGFIYDQAPSNVVYASNGGTEVAEAPVAHKIRLTAPNRKLR